MPKPKPGTIYKRGYDQKDLENAMVMLRNGVLVSKAAKECNIPITTLLGKWKKIKRGELEHAEIQQSHLPITVETELANWIISSSNSGKPISFTEFKLAVMNQCTLRHGPKCRYHGIVPKQQLLKGFYKRHPDTKGKLVSRDVVNDISALHTTAWNQDLDIKEFEANDDTYDDCEEQNFQLCSSDIKLEPSLTPPPPLQSLPDQLSSSFIDSLDALNVENVIKSGNLPPWFDASEYSNALKEVKESWVKERRSFIKSLKESD